MVAESVLPLWPTSNSQVSLAQHLGPGGHSRMESSRLCYSSHRLALQQQDDLPKPKPALASLLLRIPQCLPIALTRKNNQDDGIRELKI